MSLFIQQQVFQHNPRRLKEKLRIAHNFSRAAKQYDLSAKLQHDVARNLMLYLPENAKCVLDLGCGTGKWTNALAVKYRDAQVTGIDFSMGMLQEAKNRYYRNVKWCAGDIETIPFADNSVDLAFSNLAVQWCQLGDVLNEVARVLRPNGYFVCSTLTKGSLTEMQQLWQKVDQTSHTNQYDSPEQQLRVCHQSSLALEKSHQQQITFYYTGVMELLREFKSMGINTVTGDRMKGLMHPAKLQRFMMAYEARRQRQGIPCTYQILYIILTKKSY